MFVSQKSVQLVGVIHMLIGVTDTFASLARQKARTRNEKRRSNRTLNRSG